MKHYKDGSGINGAPTLVISVALIVGWSIGSVPTWLRIASPSCCSTHHEDEPRMNERPKKRRVRHRVWMIRNSSGDLLRRVVAEGGGISHTEALRRLGGTWRVEEVGWVEGWIRVRPDLVSCGPA